MDSRDTRNRTEASPTPWAYTTTIRYPEFLPLKGRDAENRTRVSRTRIANTTAVLHPDSKYFIKNNGVSGCWESNPDLMLPKQAYYHYTTARNGQIQLGPFGYTSRKMKPLQVFGGVFNVLWHSALDGFFSQ